MASVDARCCVVCGENIIRCNYTCLSKSNKISTGTSSDSVLFKKRRDTIRTLEHVLGITIHSDVKNYICRPCDRVANNLTKSWNTLRTLHYGDPEGESAAPAPTTGSLTPRKGGKRMAARVASPTSGTGSPSSGRRKRTASTFRQGPSSKLAVNAEESRFPFL